MVSDPKIPISHKMSPTSHTYLAQRILWSARQFLQVETPPLHLGGVEACDSPKCGELGSIICESWGLRSRSPLKKKKTRKKNEFTLSLYSPLPHLNIAVKSKMIVSSIYQISAVEVTHFSLPMSFFPLFLRRFSQNKQSNNSEFCHCW